MLHIMHASICLLLAHLKWMSLFGNVVVVVVSVFVLSFVAKYFPSHFGGEEKNKTTWFAFTHIRTPIHSKPHKFKYHFSHNQMHFINQQTDFQLHEIARLFGSKKFDEQIVKVDKLKVLGFLFWFLILQSSFWKFFEIPLATKLC